MALALIVATLFSLFGIAASLVYGFWTAGNMHYFNTHFLLAIPSTFIAVLSHSMTMFYFIGTGKWLKEQAARLDPVMDVRREILLIKRRYFGPSLLVILVTMATTILGGGVHTRALPGWVHGWMGGIALVLNVYVFVLALRYVGRNNELMQQVAERVDALEPLPDAAGAALNTR